MTRTFSCDRCGKEFTAARDASYCSPKCRTAAHRDRKNPQRPRNRHPLPSSVWSRTWATAKASSALLELSGDDRWIKFRNTDQAAMMRGELERAVERLQAVIEAIPEPSHVVTPVTVPASPEEVEALESAIEAGSFEVEPKNKK